MYTSPVWAFNSSTSVAEFLPAFTHNRAAAIIFLHPVLATWALFKFIATDKLLELFILFPIMIVYSIFGAGHPIMVLRSASKAVMLVTSRASIIGEFVIKGKGNLTACCWAPRCITTVHLYILVEGKLVILL